eukprot:Pgem_evm1s4513
MLATSTSITDASLCKVNVANLSFETVTVQWSNFDSNNIINEHTLETNRGIKLDCDDASSCRIKYYYNQTNGDKRWCPSKNGNPSTYAAQCG